MQSGYVKIWRKSIENGWLQNPKLWAFWCYCLIKASHKEITITVGLQRVNLKPGQFVFGRLKASKDLKINESSIRRIIKLLVDSGNITIKSTNKFSIITIMNWHIYQGDKSESDHQATIKRPSSDHKQECKALKEDIYAHFEIFWKAYPKKKSKGQAEKTWKKLYNNNGFPKLAVLLAAIEKQKNSAEWLKQNGQFIPYASSWLNAKGWLDEFQLEEETVIIYD